MLGPAAEEVCPVSASPAGFDLAMVTLSPEGSVISFGADDDELSLGNEEDFALAPVPDLAALEVPFDWSRCTGAVELFPPRPRCRPRAGRSPEEPPRRAAFDDPDASFVFWPFPAESDCPVEVEALTCATEPDLVPVPSSLLLLGSRGAGSALTSGTSGKAMF